VIGVVKTLNITPESVVSAINKKTKGIMSAHTMGNPAKISEIKEIAMENRLFIIEDCCDALGSRYDNRLCGTFGNASTFSFYPAHGITLGEGGAITTNEPALKRVIHSLRDWGRDCWCATDEKNPYGSCNKRFDYMLGDMPYYHKYVYSTIGYNMKPLELQAAMGIEQLKRLDGFNEIRKKNFRIYSEEMKQFDRFLELPEINKKAEPIFFGLPIIINNPEVKRQELIKFLNKNKIATRLLFGGNLLKHPAYKGIDYSAYGNLEYTDKLMKDCFWIGIHPGIDEEMIKFIVSKFREYFSTNIRGG
jgi:CDP-6-deoxy-D-xylo-4-hexulose-3-dehydrase